MIRASSDLTPLDPATAALSGTYKEVHRIGTAFKIGYDLAVERIAGTGGQTQTPSLTRTAYGLCKFYHYQRRPLSKQRIEWPPRYQNSNERSER